MTSSEIPRWQDKYQEYDRMFSPMKCAQDEIDDLRAELVRIEEHGTPWVPELLEWLEKHDCCPPLPFTDYELIESLEARFGRPNPPQPSASVEDVEAQARELLIQEMERGGAEETARIMRNSDDRDDWWAAFAIRAITAALRTRSGGVEARTAPAMTVIDPDQWEPCSPAYLSGGGSCDAPRVWNAETGNHWHPKRTAPVEGEPVAFRYVHLVDGDAGSWQPIENLTPDYRARLAADGCDFEFAYTASPATTAPVVGDGALDAERYRYLRDVADPDSDSGIAVSFERMNDWGKWCREHLAGEALDKAIDTARTVSRGDA